MKPNVCVGSGAAAEIYIGMRRTTRGDDDDDNDARERGRSRRDAMYMYN